MKSSNNRTTVAAEKQGPTFTNPSPALDASTGSKAQVISVDIVDSLAGVDEDTIALYVKVGSPSATRSAMNTGYREVKKSSNKKMTVEAITDGFRASIALSDVTGLGSVTPSTSPTISWYARAKDEAGNAGQSDSKDSTEDVFDDYTFTVDGKPASIDIVYTGDWFDAGAKMVKGDRKLGVYNNVTKYLPGSSKNTSIRVMFSEAIDGDTVNSSDFTVDGEEPSSAQWYGEGDTNPNEDPDEDSIAASVFLTVPAMDSNARPVVALVGSISDKAGNATTSGNKKAEDGIAPTATLTVDKALSNQNVVVTVTTDERIRDLTPKLKLYISDALDDGYSALTRPTSSPSPVKTLTTRRRQEGNSRDRGQSRHSPDQRKLCPRPA